MPRPPRHFRENHLFEATMRGMQGRHFFVPGKRINQLIIGALAYAQKKYGMRICYPVSEEESAPFSPSSPFFWMTLNGQAQGCQSKSAIGAYRRADTLENGRWPTVKATTQFGIKPNL